MADRPSPEARAALASAAAELFAQRGTARVSVREVAEHAGVNHGLVHYYFGSKEGLIAAALDHCAAAVAADLAAAEEEVGGGGSHRIDRWDPTLLFRPGSATEQHGRLVAQLILEGRDPTTIQSAFPAVRTLVDRLVAAGRDAGEARATAAAVTALVLGWHLFEPFLAGAAGLDRSDEERVALLRAAVTRLVGPAPIPDGAKARRR